MQKIYFFVQSLLCFWIFFPISTQGQNCASLQATFSAYESRCAATGSIKATVTGGSGSYKYKTTGPVNTNFTTHDSLTGLSAGIYTVTINDIVTNCTFIQNNVVVPGSYQDPRFTLSAVHVSCDNGNNASITVNGQQFGRSPFAYSIVAPSPMGIGTTNSTGVFTNLVGGDYRIQMTDSCGGIQTRSITVDNYTWWIDSYGFTKTSCENASGFIKVIDSRGNVSTIAPIPGFMYGIVRQPGDTLWSAGSSLAADVTGLSTVDLIARDGCGIIKKASPAIKFNASVGASVGFSSANCSSFTASLTSIKNFFSPQYCLFNNANVELSCNTTGIFTGLAYGSYCIKAHDACLDTTISRCFTVAPPPLTVGNTVNISNQNCTNFSASISGQNGLTNPTYCLYDAVGTEITCNATGIFNNLVYGSYCIKVKDGCRDTTITRCFTGSRLRPQIAPVIVPSYLDCTNISVVVGGTNLFDPIYCLSDNVGNIISCNSTGIFNNLLTGNHCVTVYDACYDTTIKRCFTVGAPVLVNDLTTTVSNQNCTTFTIKAVTHNLTSAQYCLYTASDVLISCNATGVFNNLAYGSYCVKATNQCPEGLFVKCITVSPPVPSVKNTVNITNKACATFSVGISNQQNLTTPNYCIYDNNNVLIRCNTTGIFDNLNYGSYCIKIVNSCYDTTIVRCFSAAPKPIAVAVTSSKSCSYGYASFGISVSGGNLPVNIKIFNPDGSLFLTKTFNLTSFSIDSIPGVIAGETYNVVATDACGVIDSIKAGAVASMANHSATVIAQCPSAAWQNGSGKIQLSTSTNMGIFTVRVIKKNGVTLSPQLVPNSVAGGLFTFNDLGAGTYIISYKLNDVCNRYLYDTVTIAPYFYPNLNRSSAYQCDVSGFSIGAVANNGVGPFSYEIIGSSPEIPFINAPPQASPIFNIDNGVNYSLVRLRALDACGNATLGDASILPLADFKILVDSNCFQSTSTLSVDTIYNSTYAWYRKENFDSKDSSYLGSGYSVFIPFLSASDTGTFICHLAVNNGCVKRTYVHNLTGLCYLILPVNVLSFTGILVDDKVLLNWNLTNHADVKSFIVERMNSDNKFVEIGTLTNQPGNMGLRKYDFRDTKPLPGINNYRIRFIYKDNSVTYSNMIIIKKGIRGANILCYPNPAADILNVNFNTSLRHVYKVTLLNMLNQGVYEKDFITGNNAILQIPRSRAIQKGMYILRVIDMNTYEEFSEKIIFL